MNAESAKQETDFCSVLEILQREYDMASPEGKTAFFREAARRLIAFEDELERNNYIEAVAKEYKVSAESLQKLVTKTAISDGLAKPAECPKSSSDKNVKKEDVYLTSQKVLLTWMIDDGKLFGTISKYISPSDFTEELYRTVAEFLYSQYEQGELNPAKILNHFTEEEKHREAASLFHTRIRELSSKEEREQALLETILRVKKHSIDVQTKIWSRRIWQAAKADEREKETDGLEETAYFNRLRIK